MGFSLNSAVKPQTNELNRKALIHSKDTSPVKRRYVEGEKPSFNKRDITYLLKNIRKIYKLPFSMNKTVRLIKNDRFAINTRITREIFEELDRLIQDLGVDDYGFFEIEPENIFKDCGVPHKFALVFSSGMDMKAFKTAPGIECQLEVAKVYYKTGNIANRVAEFLQGKGFGASPNHSMGGQLDYSMAAEWAGIAVAGRHSMAITKKNGPCNRIAVVYTNIENLSDFIIRKNDDMLWIKDFCLKCGKCQRKCPTEAILNEPVVLDGFNPTRIDYQKCSEGFIHYGCGICIKECPFSKGNYERIMESYKKTNES
ncbi:MAG: 4Fe-4S protein [Clostridiales bacterium]|jgi:ferredoxin|nr:4Fe-4S protein [Clostridiales bacterium]